MPSSIPIPSLHRTNKIGNAKVTCVNPINLAAEELYNCAGEGDRAVQCTQSLIYGLTAIYVFDEMRPCLRGLRAFIFESHTHPAFLLLTLCFLSLGGATIQIGRAQECCEGYICEPGNVKVTCTKRENVAMEDLRVCAAEVRAMFYQWMSLYLLPLKYF